MNNNNHIEQLIIVQVSSELQESTTVLEMSTSTSTTTRPRSLSLEYSILEIVVAALTILGNSLVIYVFAQNRSVRRYCNFYIVSLAIADLLVGVVGTPFALILSIGYPENLHACLFTICTLMGLCYVSIVCLVGVSLDRYWAITSPFSYYSSMNNRKVIGIVVLCWSIGFVLGFLPMMGWYNKDGWSPETRACFVTEIVEYNYLVFICFSAVVLPALLLSFMYGYIYIILRSKMSQSQTTIISQAAANPPPPTNDSFQDFYIGTETEHGRTTSSHHSSTSSSNPQLILCILSQAEVKAAMKLGILIITFVVCWLPLYTINTIQAFCPSCPVPLSLLNFTIVLSHANSAINPFIYAWHLKEFRETMWSTLKAGFKAVVKIVSCFNSDENDNGAISVPNSNYSTNPIGSYPTNNNTVLIIDT